MGNSTQRQRVEDDVLEADRRGRRRRCRGEKVYVWHHPETPNFLAPPEKDIPSPQLVMELEGKIITQIDCGDIYTCVTGAYLQKNGHFTNYFV